jgi:hypothetical protein
LRECLTQSISTCCLNKEADVQSRGKRFEKLTASDILTVLIYDMGTGTAIKKEEKVQASFTLPLAAVRLVEAAARASPKRFELNIAMILAR